MLRRLLNLRGIQMDVLNDIRKVLPKGFESFIQKIHYKVNHHKVNQMNLRLIRQKKLLFQDVLFVRKKESRNQQNDFAKIAKNLFALSTQLYQRHLFVKIVLIIHPNT